MTAGAPVFTPEVEEILRDVASDPRSSLLKVDRPQHFRGLFERYSNVGPRTAGLTSAEREILRVHRGDVARLLGDVCRARLAADKIRNTTSFSVDREVRVLTPQELDSRARALMDKPAGQGEDIRGLVSRCVTQGMRDQCSIADLAVAIMRLQPDDSARILAGMDLTAHGHARYALDLYQVVLTRYPRMEIRAVVWDNIANALAHLNEGVLAFRASRFASACCANDSVSRFVSLFLAFELDLDQEVESIAKEINDLVDEKHPTVDWYVHSIASRLTAGDWTPTDSSRSVATSIRDRVGGAAGRIANVWR